MAAKIKASAANDEEGKEEKEAVGQMSRAEMQEIIESQKR